MIVSWKSPSGDGSGVSISGDLKLAAVLSRVEALNGTVKDLVGNVVNATANGYDDVKDNGANRGARYLCALVTPGLMAEAYELNLWQQVVIDVDVMDKEVFLEYDAGTRYYYISL